MFCLLVETSGLEGSLAFCSIDKKKKIEGILAVETWSRLNHSGYITEAFQNLLKKLKIQSSAITSIALSIGPGRFTGLRVGLSFAKTIAFVHQIPIYPICSLEILAASWFHQEMPVLSLLNAFKNSLYIALYQKKGFVVKKIISPQVVKPTKLQDLVREKCVCVGDGFFVYENFFSEELKSLLSIKKNKFPEMQYFASLLKYHWPHIQPLSWKDLTPLYLRSPVSSIKK